MFFLKCSDIAQLNMGFCVIRRTSLLRDVAQLVYIINDDYPLPETHSAAIAQGAERAVQVNQIETKIIRQFLLRKW
jgi:hypothetical protein